MDQDPGCNTVNLAIVIRDNNLVDYNIIILHTGLELDNDWDCLHYIDYVQCPVMMYCTLVTCHIITRDMYCLCHRGLVKGKWTFKHIHPLN